MEPIDIYNKFHDKQDFDDAIGGVATIGMIIKVCKELKPKHVLELGGGKGTLSYTVLKNCDASIDIYENLPKFREIIDKNLFEYKDRYSIIPSYFTLPPYRNYDLIIVDGGKNAVNEGSFRQAIASYLVSLDSFVTIIIEGQRKSQRYCVTDIIWPHYMYTPTQYFDPSGNKKKGLLKIDCVPSNNIVKNFINHLRWRKKIYTE